jgi:hypothetical protein
VYFVGTKIVVLALTTPEDHLIDTTFEYNPRRLLSVA